jgi:hypothetical protein|eukprot:COSAG01_NODE_3780_length_5700_cov_36.154080_7_plen_84_part_00
MARKTLANGESTGVRDEALCGSVDSMRWAEMLLIGYISCGTLLWVGSALLYIMLAPDAGKMFGLTVSHLYDLLVRPKSFRGAH